MEMLYDKKFKDETVELDGKGFTRCSFIGCHLIFRGREPFGLSAPVIKRTTMEFADQAALTITAIKELWNAGDSFKQWIEYELVSRGLPKPDH